MNLRKWFREAAALGTVAVLAAALSQSVGTPAHAVSSPAAAWRVGAALATDTFDRTGTTLGSAPLGGQWSTSSPTGVLTLASGEAAWSGFRRGQTTHAWLGDVAALNQQLTASVPFGLISRAQYGMSHRIVVRRQANGDGYFTTASVLGSGQVSLGVSRVRNRVVTPLASLARAATLRTNAVLHVQTRVVGSRVVYVVARAWVEGTPVPAWQVAYADSSADAIRSRGAVGVNATMATTGAARSFRLTRIHARQLLAP